MKRGKILFCLQTWSGDLAQAEALARLVTDLTLQSNAGQKSPHADMLWAFRWDTHFPMDSVRYCARAFENVRMFRTRERAQGWPQGPNSVARETFRYFSGRQQDGVWGYSGIFLTEPDSAPLAADCLARIHLEWSATPKPVLGCIVGSFTGSGSAQGEAHTNGNCVISPDLASVAPKVFSFAPSIAWDAHWRRELVPLTQPSRMIFSDYKLGSEENPWRGCDHIWRAVEYSNGHPLQGVSYFPAWLHGVKSPDGLRCARERLIRVDDGSKNVRRLTESVDGVKEASVPLTQQNAVIPVRSGER